MHGDQQLWKWSIERLTGDCLEKDVMVATRPVWHCRDAARPLRLFINNTAIVYTLQLTKVSVVRLGYSANTITPTAIFNFDHRQHIYMLCVCVCTIIAWLSMLLNKLTVIVRLRANRVFPTIFRLPQNENIL